MLTIHDLKNALPRGGAKSNQYEIEIVIPAILKEYYKHSGDYNEKLSTFTTLCHDVRIPGQQMTTPSIWVQGQEFKQRGKIFYSGNFTAKFYLDESLLQKRAMEAWQRAIDLFLGPGVGTILPFALGGLGGAILNVLSQVIGHKSAIGYMSEIHLHQLVGNKKKGASYKIYHAFPVRVSDISYSGSSQAKLQEIEVEFAFAYINCEQSL